ncbi:MAG: cupin domain-containing protein [Gaiellaceae bacterium]
MTGGRYWVKRLDELPLVPTGDPNDFDWYPIQHHLGFGAFGVNGFGGDAGTMLVSEHDERESGQEELYVVVEGTVAFTLDGEARQLSAVSFVAVPDPGVTRSAVAVEDGTLLLAIGAPAGSGFRTTWNRENFEQVPRAD